MQLDVLNLPIISPYKNTWLVKATFGSADPVDLNVEIRIDGAAVTDWFTQDTLSSYINANFAGQTASLRLNDENMLLLENLKNTDNGLGTIELHSLPDGFEADAVMFSFEDPDGADIVTASTTPVPSQFTIKETDRPANDQTYTFADIPLAELDRFTPSIHISITDETSSTEVSGLFYAVNESNQITITGLVNTIGTDKEYTLTISPVQGIFTTPSDSNITITEPNSENSGNDFSPGFGTFSPNNSFTITNTGDATETVYSLVVPFGGAHVRDWLTQNEFPNYFTAVTFAGQTGSLSFDENSIAIEGNIYNVPNGNIVLTTNLPPGYSITGHDALTDPDGPGLAEIITDGDEDSITIIEDENPIENTKTYPVRINLAAYRSPVEASHISAIFNENAANPSNIEIRGTDIIIKGFPNITGDSIDAGSIDITPSPAYTVDTSSFKFDNPEGTDAQEITVGTVNVTLSAGSAVTHTIKVSLSRYYQLIIRSQHVVDNPVTIGSGDTVRLMNLEACDILPAPDIEIVDITSASVSGFPSYFDRDIDTLTSDSPSVYQINRTLHIEDSNGNVLDELFTVTVVNFPNCDATAISGSGTNAASAYEIDSATKLELVSYLVQNDNANYGSKFYKLTADIDLGLADLPWSQTAGGEGFPPIGIDDATSFNGTFDCDSKTIFNLYIKRQSDYTGLFGYASNNAAIQNCNLIGVYVSGGGRVGGLVGTITNSSNITNSYVSGSVSGNYYFIGGLAGYLNASSITNSYATSSVSGATAVGGLVGQLYSSRIENSYATGSVSGTNDRIGGLVGTVTNSSNITNSYATGNVSGGGRVGGLVGNLRTNSSITNSYWDTVASGRTNSGGGTPKPTSDLKTALAPAATIYTGWDTTVWKFDPDNQYPRLLTVACANRQYAADPSIACGVLQ